MKATQIGAALLGSTFLAATPALAQQAPEPPATAAPTVEDAQPGDGDIIVTAQRTETKLSRTPVAISVVGGDLLVKANIRTEQDLQIATPGLTVRAGQNANQLNYAIRGQSLDAYSYGRPGVLPYFNEVQAGNPSGASSIFYDLQSVQVLKGPQGTLFGRNSTGGAVLFTTTTPSYEFGGYASLLGGNYGTFKGEGAVNVPIAKDAAALRIAGFYSTTDGFQENGFTGSRLGDSERYGARASLRIDAGALNNTLVVDYQHGQGTNLTSVLGNLDPTQVGAFPAVALYDPASSDFVLGLVLQSLGVPPAAASAIATGNYARYLAANPKANPLGLGAVFAEQQRRGPFKVNSDATGNFRFENWQISNVTTFDISDALQIKNVFGYVNQAGEQIIDTDGSAFRIVQGVGDGTITRAEAISEELQASGDLGQLRYVAGFYFSSETARFRQSSSFFDIIPTGLLAGNPAITGIYQQNNFSRRNKTYAVYAQGTYDLSDAINPGLSFTAGARYTREKIRGTTDPGDAGFNLATTGLLAPDGTVLLPASQFSNDQSQQFNNVSWTLGLNQQVNDQLLLYVASRRSYKNGGFNGLLQPRIGFAGASVIPGNAYQRETVTDAEFGAKFNGRVGGAPASVNIATYYNWIENSQRTAFASVNGSPASITVNVPKARVYGAELDGSISPTSWLRVGGTLNYTNAKFTDNVVAVGASTQVFGTYPDTPKWSGGAYADLTFPANADVDVLLHGDVFAQKGTFFSSTGNLNTGARLPGYAIVNFRVGLQDNVRGWSVTANLKNAFDRVHYVGGLGVAQLLQFNSIVPGAPQTFTVEARLNF